MKRLLALVLLLTACTPAAVTETSTTQSASPTTSPTESTSVEPTPFEYRVGMARDVSTLNPWASADRSPWSAFVLGRTTSSLYRPAPDSIAVVEDLAVGPAPEPVETDGSWVVEVEVDGIWSDGEPVTAGDLAFTFDTVRRLSLAGDWPNWFPDSLVDIAVENDLAVITFAANPGLFVWPFAVGLAPILPRHYWQPQVVDLDTSDALYALSGDEAPSAGAFAISRRVETEEIQLTPNPAWSGWVGDPAVDILTYAIYPSVAEALTAVQLGEIDVAIDPDGISADVQGATASAGTDTMVSQTNGFRFLAFNLSRPVTGDLGFRLAVAAIANRPERPAGAELGGGFTLPKENLRWYRANLADAISVPGGDWIETAVMALADSGFQWSTHPRADTPGTGLTLDGTAVAPLELLVPEEDSVRRAYAEYLREGLTQLGFSIQIVTLPLEEVVERVFAPDDRGFDYDMYLAGWNLGRPEFPTYHGAFFGTTGDGRGLNNNTSFSSPAFDALLDRFSATRDADEAIRIVWEMEKILVQQRPYVVLYTEPMVEMYRSDRISFPFASTLGGLQASGGAPELVEPAR